MWIVNVMCDCDCVEMDAVEPATWWAFIRTRCALVPVIYIFIYLYIDIWYDYEIYGRAAQDEIFPVVMDLFIDIWTIKYDRSVVSYSPRSWPVCWWAIPRGHYWYKRAVGLIYYYYIIITILFLGSIVIPLHKCWLLSLIYIILSIALYMHIFTYILLYYIYSIDNLWLIINLLSEAWLPSIIFQVSNLLSLDHLGLPISFFPGSQCNFYLYFKTCN